MTMFRAQQVNPDRGLLVTAIERLALLVAGFNGSDIA